MGAMKNFADLPVMYRRAYSGAKSRAKKLNRPVLSEQEFISLCERADGRCEFSGIAFENEAIYSAVGSSGKPFNNYPWTPSIDRIDQAGGYALSNCRLVCNHVNTALGLFPDEVLARICHAFVAKNGM